MRCKEEEERIQIICKTQNRDLPPSGPFSQILSHLTETGWELGRGGGELCVGAVSQHCGESDTGEVCMWEELWGGELCWRTCGGAMFHSCL